MPRRRGAEDDRLAEAVLGLRLRVAREANGLSQADVAKTLGYKDNTQISRLERGNRVASWAEVVKLMGALDLTFDELAAEPTPEERAEVSAVRRTFERRKSGRATRRGLP